MAQSYANYALAQIKGDVFKSTLMIIARALLREPCIQRYSLSYIHQPALIMESSPFALPDGPDVPRLIGEPVPISQQWPLLRNAAKGRPAHLASVFGHHGHHGIADARKAGTPRLGSRRCAAVVRRRASSHRSACRRRH